MSVFAVDARLSPADARAKFGDAQGNILKGHGREHTQLFFVEFTSVSHARQWIGQLVAGLSTGPSAATDTVRITSTEKQLTDSEKFAVSKHKDDAGLFTSLLLTAAGLKLLGAATPHEALDQAPGSGPANAFASGMRASGAQLHDPSPADWDKGWWQANGQPSPIHALLLLADNEPTRLGPAVNFMRERSESLGVRVRIEQVGSRLRDADGHDIEHFGYADGVSQPLYVQGTPDVPPHERDVALGAEDLVLVPDALDPAGHSFGSFMVFRKLEQHVRAFKEAEGEDAKPGEGGLANELGLTGGDRARAGAMVVGRFENGTPLTLSATEVDEQHKKPIFTNNFTYDDDKEGLKCPFHAHIRKVNPRGETHDANELKHRITRRGVPYGPMLPDGAPEDHVSRGLLFICYQRNIGQQFEFMQQAWANEATFLRPSVLAGPVTGLDPVIGQGPRVDLTFPTVWDERATQPAAFTQHVFLKGGEYFYAPSISGLQALASGASA